MSAVVFGKSSQSRTLSFEYLHTGCSLRPRTKFQRYLSEASVELKRSHGAQDGKMLWCRWLNGTTAGLASNLDSLSPECSKSVQLEPGIIKMRWAYTEI